MKRIFSICLTLALVACATEQQIEFDENRAIWQDAELAHYRYQLNFLCFCSFFESMPLVIEVQDEKIVSLEPFGGDAITEDDRRYFEENGTIDQIFTRLEAAIREDPDYFEARYSLEYGFPTYIRVDYSKEFGDDEFTLIISEFEVLP